VSRVVHSCLASYPTTGNVNRRVDETSDGARCRSTGTWSGGLRAARPGRNGGTRVAWRRHGRAAQQGRTLVLNLHDLSSSPRGAHASLLNYSSPFRGHDLSNAMVLEYDRNNNMRIILPAVTYRVTGGSSHQHTKVDVFCR